VGGTVVTFHPGALRGSVRVPGDKSISHRALIAGAGSAAPMRVANLNDGRDVRATREALTALGVRIAMEGSETVVHGGRLAAPTVPLDCMNSGSTARMLLGACAGAAIRARFDGDASLRRRPMEPVAAQLRAFGARIETTAGHLPLELGGRPEIETLHFILLAPSAQVKSALIFAALFAGVAITIEGDAGSRDHTERLLRHFGAEIEWTPTSMRLGTAAITGGPIVVPGDFSAAAFFIAAAAVTPNSSILLRDVGVNPTRTGLLDALQAMGAAIEVRNRRTPYGEPVADIAVEYRPLRAIAIGREVALRAIDEIPLLAIAAAGAGGETTIAGVGDLRTKESDRLAAIERLLRAVGIEARYERGLLRISGGKPEGRGALVTTNDDHRIAMATGVLASVAGPLTVDDAESLAVSFPGFVGALQALQGA
jgi:3-phosphoshikimate 1-carboxyvinyltransferase